MGAHISVAGGLLTALPRAAAVGAEALQIFVANPRGWAPPAPDPDGDAAFREQCTLPVFVHAPYLINFGSPSPETLTRSVDALRFSLRRGRDVGARGVVVHAGSAVLGNRWEDAMIQVREQVLPLLDDVADGPRLLVEPTAGGSRALASDADSLGAYLDALDRDERVGVCLDTCHMHAAGHDLSTTATFARALRAYGSAIGRGRLGLVHVNDSRDPVGSKGTGTRPSVRARSAATRSRRCSAPRSHVASRWSSRPLTPSTPPTSPSSSPYATRRSDRPPRLTCRG